MREFLGSTGYAGGVQFKWLICLMILLFFQSPAWGSKTLEFLPKGRLSRINGADPREVRMAFLWGAKASALIGNYISLLGVESYGAFPQQMHVGIEGAGFFGLSQAESRFPLETTDGLVGLYWEGRERSWVFQLRYTHVSAHLSDGSLDIPISYSREWVSLKLSYQPLSKWHVYSGISYLLHTIPELPRFGFQVGGTTFLSSSQKAAIPFSSFDLKWKEETSINPSLSLQVGVAFNNPPEAYRSFRVFYNYFTGSDYRGQYYSASFTNHSLGIEMQL